MTGKVQARLVPARPAAETETSSFRPRIPWRWIGLGAVTAAALVALYVVREHHRVDALRQQILSARGHALAEPLRRYAATRSTLEALILNAAKTNPDRWADPRLRLNGLHSGRGLYLRIPAEDASSPESLARAASTAPADGIPACLGLAPSAARGLWDKGAFLSKEWAEQVKKQDTLLRLRVTESVLARQVKADLSSVVELLRSDWFLLVLEQPRGTRRGTVDAFLWDLHSQQALLRARIVGDGVLLSARIRSKDAAPAPRPAPGPLADEVASDCSIAAQLRTLAEHPASAAPTP